MKNLSVYGFVYIIENLINKKIYIGQTIGSLQKRWWEHRWHARHNPSFPLHRAIKKHGEENFTKKILGVAYNSVQLNHLENSYIVLLQSSLPEYGYNLTFPAPENGGEAWRKKLSIRSSRSKNPAYRHDLLDAELVELYSEGFLIIDIARKFCASETAIRDRLIGQGVHIKKVERPHRGEQCHQYRKDVPTSALIKEYKEGLSTLALSRKYKMNKSSIRRRLLKAGVKLRNA
jgi:group I intron endonuclease